MKSPRFVIALAGVLALAGTTYAGSPALSMLLLPQAFGQEPVPVSAQAAQEPELLPMPRVVAPAKDTRPRATVGVVTGIPYVFEDACAQAAAWFAQNGVRETRSCAKPCGACESCAKPAVGLPAEAYDNSSPAAAKACKCCENCEDCKDCTCGKKKACKCCEDCKDCKDCTCGKKKTAGFQIGQGYNTDNGLGGIHSLGRPFVTANPCTGCEKCAGVQMTVTPKILPDGRVLMRIVPEVSSVVPTPVQLGNGQLGTARNIQRNEMTVLAADGETVVLGGMKQKQDGTCDTKKFTWIHPELGAQGLGSNWIGPGAQYYLVQLPGPASPRVVGSQKPPLAVEFREPPALESLEKELYRERQRIADAIRHVEAQLINLAWQQKVGQCQAVVATHTTQAAHLVTKHFEAHCDMIRCVGDDPNTLILEGNVRLSCKTAGARIEASRVVVNLANGAFTVQALQTVVPAPPAPPVPYPATMLPVRPTSLNVPPVCPTPSPIVLPSLPPSTGPTPIVVPNPY